MSLKQQTAKGILWSGLGSGAQQLLNLFFGIFLSRLLNDYDYGMIGMLAIFTLIANSLMESGFISALANKKSVSHTDYNAVFWFSALTGILLYGVLFLLAPLIADFYGKEELIPLSRYLFLAFVASGFGIASRALLFRNLKTKELAITSTVALSVSGVVGIILAYNGMSYWGIATQNVVYCSMITLGNCFFARWRPTFQIDFSPLRQMIGFSSKLLITNVFTHLNNNLFSVLFGKIYSPIEVGNYTQASKWNYMGHSLISTTMQNVAQPVLAQVSDNNERQKTVFRKMLRFTAFISFPVMLGFSLVSRELIIIAITEKWLAAVAILQLLCIDGAFTPIAKLYTHLIISKGKSNIYMWNTITLCLVQLGTMLLIYPYGIQTMIITFVAINALWLLTWHYFVWRLIGLTLWSALKDILPFALIAAAVMGATYFITLGIENIYVLFVAKIAIAAPTYFAILWALDAKILKESIHFFMKRKTPDA